MGAIPQKVAYDSRAILINGERTLLLSGAIHYPRSTPDMWPDLFRRSREAGLNVIETYVFWNLHEQERGSYDFTDRLNLRYFCELAQQHGLYVILRIGPYICAEINYGGLPAWLKELPGIQMRTNNDIFKTEVERWVRNLCDYLKPYFAPNGGPIILAQMENEYNLISHIYGEEGQQYLQWSADLGEALNLGIPLIMCYGAAEGPIETMNSNTAHELIADYRERHPDQPALWTENWPGWYDVYGNPHHTRSAEHVAYAVARFVAAGGTGVNYYMWHGGTNFARESMFLQTTSYDYDAPLDEYGFPTTKYYHLADLHQHIKEHQDLLLGQNPPQAIALGAQQNAYSYQNSDTTLVFLCNDAKEAVTIHWQEQAIELAPESVQVLSNNTVIFRSNVIAEQHTVQREITSLDVLHTFSWWQEPYGISEPRASVTHHTPIEQLQLTHDTTDYCWYVTNITVESEGTGQLRLEGVADLSYIFINGERVAQSSPYLCERRGTFDNDNYIHTFELTLPAGTHQLAILCCAVGLIKGDWMIGDQNMVLERKGIWGNVSWNGNILQGNWSMQPGLQGEHQKRYADASKALTWQSTAPAGDQPLTWWQSNFTFTASQTNTAFVIDMTGMHKGLLWLNGRCLGRYWLLPVKERYEDGTPTGKIHPADEITQRYYHVPTEWLQEENSLIILEEIGGTPEHIKLSQIH